MQRAWIAAAMGAALLVGTAQAESRFTFVDFQSQATHRLTEDLHESQGNNFGEMPQGELKFEASRFKIGEGFLHLYGKVGAPKKPNQIKDIKVGAKFDRLHILQSTGYGEAEPPMKDGTEIGAFTLIYEGGKEERIPIVYGEDVRDWWDWPERTNLTRGKVAWSGTNAPAKLNERKIRAFATVWNNPHPDKAVQTIAVSSSETECDPMVFGLTLETK